MSVAQVDDDLARIVWSETAGIRDRAHAVAGGTRCRSFSSPYVDGRARVRQDCRESGCLDIMHDIYARALWRLETLGDGKPEPIVHRLAYARRVVATQIADVDRELRVARGLPAKPTRNDGIAGRVNRVLVQSCPEPLEGLWLTTLFRMIRGYVCRDNRLSAAWPLDAWATEKSRVDGSMRMICSAATRQEILGDIQRVLAIAEQVAGRTWVRESILHPLATYLVPWSDALSETVASPGLSAEDLASTAAVGRLFWTLVERGCDAQRAWTRAAREVVGRDPAVPVAEVLDELLALRPRPQGAHRGRLRLATRAEVELETTCG